MKNPKCQLLLTLSLKQLWNHHAPTAMVWRENRESGGQIAASCSGPQGNIWEGAEGLARLKASPIFFLLPVGYSQFFQVWGTLPTKHLWLKNVLSPHIPASESEEWEQVSRS